MNGDETGSASSALMWFRNSIRNHNESGIQPGASRGWGWTCRLCHWRRPDSQNDNTMAKHSCGIRGSTLSKSKAHVTLAFGENVSRRLCLLLSKFNEDYFKLDFLCWYWSALSKNNCFYKRLFCDCVWNELWTVKFRVFRTKNVPNYIRNIYMLL